MKWFSKNKTIEEPEVEEIKPTTRKAIMEIVLINNYTDKEYRYTSDNSFGLKWEYLGNYSLLVIQQKNDVDGITWTAKGRFFNFSIVEVIQETFDINEQTTEKLEN